MSHVRQTLPTEWATNRMFLGDAKLHDPLVPRGRWHQHPFSGGYIKQWRLVLLHSSLLANERASQVLRLKGICLGPVHLSGLCNSKGSIACGADYPVRGSSTGSFPVVFACGDRGDQSVCNVLK